MLPIQFFEQNIHFAINIFAAIIFFAVFWLHFDAWTAKRRKKDVYKWAGFLLLAISFLISSTTIEREFFGQQIFGDGGATLGLILRILGYAFIVIGQIADPLQKEPDLESLFSKPASTPVILPGALKSLFFLPPIGAIASAALYWRRSTKGLEKHLKPLAISFGLLSFSEMAALASQAHNINNPATAQLLAPFGPIWIVENLFLLAAVVTMGLWVWRFLLKRFLSQLYMSFVGITLMIFLITTICFTYLLMNNLQNDKLSNLLTASNVLSYAINAKKSETRANAESIAKDPVVVSAVTAKDHKVLADIIDATLSNKEVSRVVVTSNAGEVLANSDNPERWGDSVSSDTSVRRALIGEPTSSIISQDSVLAPRLFIKTAVPIYDTNKKIIGTVSASLLADSSFVDGIKNSTGLESSIYSGNVLSATTLTAPDGVTRQVGAKLKDSKINNDVLKRGLQYKNPVKLFNRNYLAVYTPLKDADNAVVGMIFIGQPQSTVLSNSGRSIELTFLISGLLLLGVIYPAYKLSQHLADQL